MISIYKPKEKTEKLLKGVALLIGIGGNKRR